MTDLSKTPRIRSAAADDAARIGAIARAAYALYVPRIGREPAPMVADFAAEVAANRVVVIEAAGSVRGYMIAQAEKLKLPALRLYTNVLMTENLSMYARIGFVETHRVVEKGFHRVYMRWSLRGGR